MIKNKPRNAARLMRHARIRNRIEGTPSIPRLNVFRSNLHIYAQIIDDSIGSTLVSASSRDKELQLKSGSTVEAAAKVGELVAKKALASNIEKVVFDRGGYLYHGRVKALAEASRNAGLKF